MGRRSSMRARGAAWLAAAALLGGCLTGAQTFEQDLALQRWKWCDKFSTITLDRIDTDGKVFVKGREDERDAFLSCMAEQAREQKRSKPSLVVPDPVLSPLPR